MLLTSLGATTVLTEALVPYGLTVTSETKINTMDTLGEGYISQRVGEYIKKGGKIATVCKLTSNFATPYMRKLLHKSLNLLFCLLLTLNTAIIR